MLHHRQSLATPILSPTPLLIQKPKATQQTKPANRKAKQTTWSAQSATPTINGATQANAKEVGRQQTQTKTRATWRALISAFAQRCSNPLLAIPDCKHCQNADLVAPSCGSGGSQGTTSNPAGSGVSSPGTPGSQPGQQSTATTSTGGFKGCDPDLVTDGCPGNEGCVAFDANDGADQQIKATIQPANSPGLCQPSFGFKGLSPGQVGEKVDTCGKLHF
ncbi:uncharacterized protein KY384_006721 [Bacidia gigantensis]|uniref:uncharacterized protein n=1 Tax=Bacidia gigantensis TaxID=2732470 RepID=UPI001D03AAC8|nr:uncharacterized protein KY384_006721 [Bacidia gigantensis]KAG8529031.1 hypothetical protein KY384_006721 [Bacidia gigantensis]